MARIRTIKPSFWKHEDLSALPEATHMLAAALLNYADDFGYFNANPMLIRAECSPLREPSIPILESLKNLSRVGYLRLGNDADGKRYGHIINFSDHQKVCHPTASAISSKSITWEDSRDILESLSNVPESFCPEGNKEGNKEKEKDIDQNSHHFDRFWKTYPRKVSKAKARSVWNKLKPDESLANKIIEAVHRHAKTAQWLKDNGNFIPHPDTWLRNRRWEDVLEQPIHHGFLRAGEFA